MTRKKSSIVGLGLTCALLAPAAYGQDAPASGKPMFPGSVFSKTATPKTDKKVLPASSALPEPTDVSTLAPSNLALPDDAIEPFLLTKREGPFMVMAKTFRGPEAERYALALVLELRNKFHLPAYILRTKDFPLHTVVQDVPPLVPPGVIKPSLTSPERDRNRDEAAVLVGNEPTLDASVKLLDQVKKLKPECLEKVSTIYFWRKDAGLKYATRTTNPFIPSQNLFPGQKKDKLVEEMNRGPHTVLKCPGRYTLQVAEFSGRSVFNPDPTKDPKMFDNASLRQSPLMTAMDDAEKLADKLAKDPDVINTGYQPYVYHDRKASRVMIGAFNAPNDPKAAALRDHLLKQSLSIEYGKGKKGKPVTTGIVQRTGMMISPSSALTDLQDPKYPIKTQ